MRFILFVHIRFVALIVPTSFVCALAARTRVLYTLRPSAVASMAAAMAAATAAMTATIVVSARRQAASRRHQTTSIIVDVKIGARFVDACVRASCQKLCELAIVPLPPSQSSLSSASLASLASLASTLRCGACDLLFCGSKWARVCVSALSTPHELARARALACSLDLSNKRERAHCVSRRDVR